MSSGTTGVYGGGAVPGNYVNTRTGVTRGEELFSRPDLERPWRTTEKQKHATHVALKEKEIEELMRLCSNLRTELGNARNDAQFLEYAVTEKMKAQVAEKEKIIEALESEAAKLRKEQIEAKESTEHQIRLLKSLHEKEVLSAKNEARLAAERCAELAKLYQKQVDDVKAACTREIQFVESRFSTRVDELVAEVKAVSEAAKVAEQHHVEQMTATKNMMTRIEADYKERLRSSEQRLDDLRKLHTAELSKERREKEDALSELRQVTEKLAISTVDRDEVVQRFKLWNNYILSGLDTFHQHFVSALPECVVEPAAAEITELPAIYGPRSALEDPDTKVTVERISYRLLQLKSIKEFKSLDGSDGNGPRSAHSTDALIDRSQEKQERLEAALKETNDKMTEMNAQVTNVLGRLYFFCDNLEYSITNAPYNAIPPQGNVIFVTLSIANGDSIWADDADTMRSAVTLLSNTVRLKMAEYGAYECYSDSISMLLAFDDAAAACRFCTECQEWLLRTPWSADILRNPLCREERSGSDNKLLFSGLRVAMAIHTGECFVEPTAIPAGNGRYRSHYYGRAVSQAVHISSLSQGGQIIISKQAWAHCLKKKHELGQLTISELGSFPIISYNSQTGTQEKQSIDLYQVAPASLKGRSFNKPSKMDVPAVSSLSGLKKAILATEIDTVVTRRAALVDALVLIKEEYASVQDELRTLLTRARNAKTHFHLLPPPEMVTQMNDLYTMMEKVAVRAEEVRTDVTHVANVLEELDDQTKGLNTYFQQNLSKESREDELLTELDVSNKRMEETMKDLRNKHRREMERLQATVQERDQVIRKLYQGVGNTV